MKKFIGSLALLLILASCTRDGNGYSDQPLEQSRNEVKKPNDSKNKVSNFVNPDESVDPKDITPPRR